MQIFRYSAYQFQDIDLISIEYQTFVAVSFTAKLAKRNKLASLEAMLVWNSAHLPTYWQGWGVELLA